MRLRLTLSILFLYSIVAPSSAGTQDSLSKNPKSATISTPLVYRNTQYGFCFLLPESWKGHTLIWEKWGGSPIDDTKGPPIEGPELRIRNPNWTDEKPYEDIPIMIFTKTQWKLADSDTYSFSAAPIGPSELAHNRRYVFGLPARFDYDFSEGWEEVIALLLDQNSLEAPCRKSAAKPSNSKAK